MPINMQIEYPKLTQENIRLQMINDSLLEALKMCINYVGGIANESEAAMNAYLKASAAIKQSEL